MKIGHRRFGTVQLGVALIGGARRRLAQFRAKVSPRLGDELPDGGIAWNRIPATGVNLDRFIKAQTADIRDDDDGLAEGGPKRSFAGGELPALSAMHQLDIEKGVVVLFEEVEVVATGGLLFAHRIGLVTMLMGYLGGQQGANPRSDKPSHNQPEI